MSYEIVIVNDGSSDGTEAYLATVSVENPNVRAINLSRNFGKEAALAAGLASAGGQCLAFIDADLQHPPELIAMMYAEWRRGSDVVNAVKRQRATEPGLYRWLAQAFNRLMTETIGSDMSGASDYKLIDRQVAEVLLNCTERNRFFRGLVAWVGFKVANVEFDVHKREVGDSKWSLWSLIRYSITNIVSFSSMPLRAVGIAGFIMAALGVVLLAQTLIRYAMGEAAIGFTTVIAVQILLSGMVLTALGVISIYLSHMYEEQKQRPIFIIRQPRTSAKPHSGDILDVAKVIASRCDDD
ncbi:MAG: glycosyltransferase family 2 protein [Candidatus Competibacter sp.]|nr:glycosyltransferase family 2 protein [Candidatus Competibacter sp.]